MIVYAGKQFWNDFNNWDEALFQDANRPRDNNMFKLRPWFQSDKWDWRWTNKNTWLPVHQYVWIAVAPSASWTYFTRVSDSWTKKQIEDCCSWYSSIISWWNVQGWTADSLLNDLNNHAQAVGSSTAYTSWKSVTLFGNANIDTLYMANNWAYMIWATVMLSPESAIWTWQQFMLYTVTSFGEEEVVSHYNGKLTALNNSEIIDSYVMWNMGKWESYYWVMQQKTGKNCLAVLTVTILQLW
jgi:hypothetical protein